MAISKLVISLTISLPHFVLIVFNNGQIALRHGYGVLRLLLFRVYWSAGKWLM